MQTAEARPCKMKADAIKQGGNKAMSDDEIAAIPVEKVYEWVRGGHWKQRHFLKWLKAMRVI